jgi:hypothetical protein
MTGTWFGFDSLNGTIHVMCYTKDGNLWWLQTDVDAGQFSAFWADPSGDRWNTDFWEHPSIPYGAWSDGMLSGVFYKGVIGACPYTPDFSYVV